MRLILDATSIYPGESAGIEHVLYGLVPHLHAELGSNFRMGIPQGTKTAYASFCSDLPLDAFVEVGDIGSDVQNGDGLGSGRNWRRRTGAHLRNVARRSVTLSNLRSLSVAISRSRRLCSYTDPDVVIYPFQRVPAVARNSVTVIHDLRPFVPGLRSGGVLDRLTLRWNVRRSSQLICSWPHPAEHLEEVFGPDIRRKLSVVPFPPSGGPVSMNGSPRQGAGSLRTGTCNVLFASATAPHKNHATLIQAAAIAREALGVRLDLCFPGPLNEPTATDLRRLVQDAGLQDHVQFMGFVEGAVLRGLYAECCVVAVPTLWEAASGAIFDGVAHGKPIVCSDIPPHTSQLRLMGISPPVVPATDAVAWARELVRASSSRQPNYEVERGQTFLSELRWDRTARAYLEVCHSAVLN